MPAEITVLLVLSVDLVSIAKYGFRLPDRLEALRHLGHVAFENAHCHGRRVLEQMVRPGERIRIERIGTAPNRRATCRIEDAHAGATLARRAVLIAPPEILEPRNQPGDVA